jgi:hypothetical protein
LTIQSVLSSLIPVLSADRCPFQHVRRERAAVGIVYTVTRKESIVITNAVELKRRIDTMRLAIHEVRETLGEIRSCPIVSNKVRVNAKLAMLDQESVLTWVDQIDGRVQGTRT